MTTLRIFKVTGGSIGHKKFDTPTKKFWLLNENLQEPLWSLIKQYPNTQERFSFGNSIERYMLRIV